MGWVGAWRQEELKRFSSWVTTKVGLPQRALGSWPGRCRGAGTMRTSAGEGSLSSVLLRLGFRSGGACCTVYKLGSTRTRTVSNGLSRLCLTHFGVCTARWKNPHRRHDSGATEISPQDQPGYAFVIIVLRTPMRKAFQISLALSPLVTEAPNIIEFTFVGTNPQREALKYTRSHTSLVAKSSSLVPNKNSFCYTSPVLSALYITP